MRNWTLNRYFARLYLTSFFSTLLAVFALIYLVDMIEVSRRGRFEDFSVGAVILFSALRVPSFIGQALPFIVLISSIYTMLLLNRRLELVVARASGVSIWQFLLPFLFSSLLLGLAATFIYNPLSAYTQSLAENLQSVDGVAGQSTGSVQVPWLRQNSEGVKSIIGADSVAERGTILHGATAYILNDENEVTKRVDADTVRLENGAWIFVNPQVIRIGYAPQTQATYRVPTSLRPEYIEQRLADPEAISIWELGSKIDIAASLGFNVMAFKMQYNTLIAQPALFFAMTLLAATVATRFSRTGQPGPVIAAGVLAGFVLYVVTFLAKALGSNGVVPPLVAAWFPVLAAGMFGVTLLLHQEDG